MFALIFRFPGGRYHATPWGRHVNEGAVAWPPEPYRIARALIAIWWRKADKERWPEGVLHRLVEGLASSDPVYRLPAAVHAHTRHYMPQGRLDKGREKTALVFDAFYRIDPTDELVAAWPELSLDDEAFGLAEQLTSMMNYLGRAESMVIGRAVKSVDGPFPVTASTENEPGLGREDVLAPLTPGDYAQVRPGLLNQNKDKPKSKGRAAFESTVPEALTDALQVETSQLQAVGWSRPPAGRMVSYRRPDVGPRPRSLATRSAPQDNQTVAARSQVARFILAGRPRPPITDAVKIGETFRRALMSCVNGPIPGVLSGRDDAGAPLRDPQHAHAFFLPEDEDDDGFIDHLVLFARPGLPAPVRQAAQRLQRLWIEKRPRQPEDDAEDGREEWRLALEGFGAAQEFDDCALLRASRTWVSVTPYLRPRHLKGDDPTEETSLMIRTECERRGWPAPIVQLERSGGGIRISGADRSVLAFHRFRSRRGLVQPDRSGLSLRLTFSEPVLGPIALGFGAHFGLGLFGGMTG